MNPPHLRLRVGDADREQTVAALQGYVASGHLTLDEFSHRSAGAHQARTHADLAALTADLPPAAEPARVARDPASRRLWTLAAVAIAAVAGIGSLAGLAHLAAAGSMMGGMC